MPDVAKRFVGPVALPNGAPATIYTVPAGATAILRYIRVTNPTGDQGFTLSIGADAVATRLFQASSVVPTYGSLEWSGFLPLSAGEFLQGYGSAANMIIVITGVEVT